MAVSIRNRFLEGDEPRAAERRAASLRAAADEAQARYNGQHAAFQACYADELADIERWRRAADAAEVKARRLRGGVR